MSEQKIRIVTHGGKFHVDDVFAVATLFLKHGRENCEVVRVEHQAETPVADYAVDTGREYDPARGRFDHHQNDASLLRDDGIPYASFGLVWKAFGVELCEGIEEVAEGIDERMVQAIDAPDNGINVGERSENGLFPYAIFNIVAGFRPTWKEGNTTELFDKRFAEVVELAEGVLAREISRSIAWHEARVLLLEIYETSEQKDLIIVDIPQEIEREIVTNTLQEFEDVKMILRRAGRSSGDDWQAVSPNISSGTFEVRTPFPKEWRGLSGSELQTVCGVKDAKFCHKSGFMAIAESKEGALELAEKALNYTQE